MGKNLEIVTSLFVLILAIGFSIWNFYNHSYTTAIIMLVIGVINIGYLIQEIIEKRRDDGNN